MKKPGKFILFEGITRTGKSTQVKAVSAALANQGIRVFQDMEPTDGPFGKVVRAVIEKERKAPYFEAVDLAWTLFRHKREERDRIISIINAMGKGEKVSVLDMQLIFMADRLWHCIGFFGKRLASGENIICDRYSPSTFAFGLSHGVELGELIGWHERILGSRYITPSLTVYVVLPPEVAVERMAKDGKVNDIFETEAGIRRTAEAYEKVWQFGRNTDYFGRIVNVDGNQPIPKVTEAILREIKKVLP